MLRTHYCLSPSLHTPTHLLDGSQLAFSAHPHTIWCLAAVKDLNQDHFNERTAACKTISCAYFPEPPSPHTQSELLDPCFTFCPASCSSRRARPPILADRPQRAPPELSAQPRPHHNTPTAAAAATAGPLCLNHTTITLIRSAGAAAGWPAAEAGARCGQIPALAAALQPYCLLQPPLQLLVQGVLGLPCDLHPGMPLPDQVLAQELDDQVNLSGQVDQAGRHSSSTRQGSAAEVCGPPWPSNFPLVSCQVSLQYHLVAPLHMQCAHPAEAGGC